MPGPFLFQIQEKALGSKLYINLLRLEIFKIEIKYTLLLSVFKVAIWLSYTLGNYLLPKWLSGFHISSNIGADQPPFLGRRKGTASLHRGPL